MLSVGAMFTLRSILRLIVLALFCSGIAMGTEAFFNPARAVTLCTLTLGLVGCGGIGQAVAKRARGVDLPLMGCDPLPPTAARDLGIEFVSMDRLLAESDFLSLHAALTPETRGFIGEAQLKAMKPSAMLINTARGAVID